MYNQIKIEPKANILDFNCKHSELLGGDYCADNGGNKAGKHVSKSHLIFHMHDHHLKSSLYYNSKSTCVKTDIYCIIRILTFV